MSVVTFSNSPTGMYVSGFERKYLAGYKVLSVIHSGEKIDLSKKRYYFVPTINRFVSFNGGVCKPLKINAQNCYNFQEKGPNSFSRSFKPNANVLHTEGLRQLGSPSRIGSDEVESYLRGV